MIKKIKNKTLKEKICDTLANKVIKCPDCGEEIDHLVTPINSSEELSLTDDGKPHYEKGEDDVIDYPSYLCPGCHAEICSDEGDAVAFLKGERDEED